MSVLDPARLEAEAGWPDLARDLVNLTLPGSGLKPSMTEVLRANGVDRDALAKIVDNPRFRTLLEAESARVKELGHRAGYANRVEVLVSLLAEQLFVKAMDADAPLGEVVRAFGALSNSVAAPEEAVRRGQGPVTNIQINVPVLKNPKLRHVDGVQLPTDGD